MKSRVAFQSVSYLVLSLLSVGCSSDPEETTPEAKGGKSGTGGRASAIAGASATAAGGSAVGLGGQSPAAGQVNSAGSAGAAVAQATGGMLVLSGGQAGSETGGQAGSTSASGGQAGEAPTTTGGAWTGGRTGIAGSGGDAWAAAGQNAVGRAGSGPAPNSACGNGVVDLGEECDDGNDRNSDGCNTTCRYGCHTFADCGDSDVCTIDTCAPTASGWACKHQIDVGYPCDDGNACTADDRCSAEGECSPGTNECACKTAADCAGFEDNNQCNGTLTCTAGRCEINPLTIITCDTTSDTECRVTVCQPATGVCSLVNETDGQSCNDGQFCTASDSCQAGACVGSSNPCAALACADGCDESARHCIASSTSRRCRTAAAACDLAEYCNGVGFDCPSDERRPSGTVCRASAGLCDLPEACNGVSVNCPTDAVRALGAVCRDAQGACDEPEACDGANTGCPSDIRVVSGSVCRSAVGDCDMAESCNGSDVDCPTDARKPAGTECRPQAGVCDLAETCGAELDCPTDALVAPGTLCRPSVNQCDVAESCSGTNAACPSDVFQSAGIACNDGNACTVTETCNGLGVCAVSNAVPPPVPSPLWPPRGWLTGSARANPERMLQRPQFRWVASADDGCGAVTYDIEVDDSCTATNFAGCSFASPEQKVAGLTATTWQPDAALAVSNAAPVGRRYFWRMRACRSGACSAWSQVRYLDVGRVANDLDGDGYSEVIVGAPEKNSTGAVLVYRGSVIGPVTTSPIERAAPTADSGQRFGSVISTGDLNADGFTDLVVAAPNRPTTTGANVGELYVYLGSVTGLAAAPERTIAAPDPQIGSVFGQGLDAESDIDGDGTADIAVGAPGQDVTTTDTGRAYVYLGLAASTVTVSPWVIDNPSADASAAFGTAIATGDITGDGFGDLAISAPAAGRLHVLFGSATQVLPQVPGAVLTQFSSIDQPTIQMSGDHESDGRINLIAGRFGWCCYAERLHVYNGTATGPTFGFNWDRGVYYVGEFGRATANGGDFNGDGRHEIVEGMPAYWNGGPGLVEVGTANSNGFAAGPVTIDNPMGFSGGRFGEWLSVRGDVNGDGFAELIVGAPEQNDVFVFLGSTTGLSAGFYTRLMNTGKFGRGMPH